jgi:hypothetical protein
MADGRLYINLNVNMAAALRAGQTRGGQMTLELTKQMLEELNPEKRELLAKYVGPEVSPQYYRPHLEVNGTEPHQIAAGIDAVMEQDKEDAARRAKYEAEAAAREAQLVEEIRTAPLADLVRDNGSRAERVGWLDGGTATRDVYEDAGRLEEVDAEVERRNAEHSSERLKREAREAEERAVRETEERETREAWVAEHGSERLKRLLQEGIEHRAVYLDERLALERKGWRWDTAVLGNRQDPRNPPDEALELLDRARETLPEGEGGLVFWVVEECSGECSDFDEGCPGFHDGWRGYAVVSEFLGRDIVFGGPEEEVE